MLSVIIKNSILMFLFLLIVHFIILNYINDTHVQHQSIHSSNMSMPDSRTCDSQRIDMDIRKDEHIDKSNEMDRISDILLETEHMFKDAIEKENNDKMKELYDFVYGDDLAEGELVNMFKDIKPECSLNDDDFVNRSIDKHFEEKELEKYEDTKDQGMHATSSTYSGNPILYTYKEQQKDMMSGYETFGSSYMSLKN